MPKDHFFLIQPEKRHRIIHAAVTLFAERGFHRTDVGEIATRSGVAKGSLYNYFNSKEDIFLYVCRYALERSREAVYAGIQDEWDIFGQLRQIFNNGALFVESNPDYLHLYLHFSSAGPASFMDALSGEVEAFTADYLKDLIKRDMDAGLVRRDLDVNTAAFLINSLYIMFVVSLVPGHFHSRLKTYLDITLEPGASRRGEVMARLLEMIERMLRPQETF